MRVAIVGAGPAGLLTGTALARRGHRVTVVDRDAGPAADGRWERSGVMQFHHAHAFRGQVAEVLLEELPEAYDGWLALGAEPVMRPDAPSTAPPAGVRSRREPLERALRHVASHEPGLALRRAHVRGVRHDGRRATGLALDGDVVPADLVLDASGRSGRVGRHLRPRTGYGGRCGIAYVDRQYRLHHDADPGPLSTPLTLQQDFDGYQVIVFPHERGIFSVLVVRRSDDRVLAGLRHEAAFEAACRAVPALAAWTDPERAAPLTPVLPGGSMLNHYRSQLDPDGDLVLDGLVAVGDTVATTTPNFGRGVALTFLQCRALLRTLDDAGDDLVGAARAFDAWCEQEISPWVRDHVEMDAATAARWAGAPVDTEARIPSDVVLATGRTDPRIWEAAAPYLQMTAGPESLDGARRLARDVLAAGWRPSFDQGPSRDELAALVIGTLAA